MNGVYKEIFRGIHEGKWISIKYQNKENSTTSYWIGIKNFNPLSGFLEVCGLHLGILQSKDFSIHIESILTASIIEGTYCKINKALVEDIATHPEKYQKYFHNPANLRILNYLAECNRLDTTPYQCEYALLQQFDDDCLDTVPYTLSEKQFQAIVSSFQIKSTNANQPTRIKQLAMNVMSIPTSFGLYVLAYQRLNLDVESRQLCAADTITVCKNFTIKGEQVSAHQFLDADDFQLLDNLKDNLELVKDRITQNNPALNGVDDMPYLMAIGCDPLVNLYHEYAGITKMFQSGEVTVPIQAFFGDLVRAPVRRKNYPLALINRNANLDQFLAIHNAIKYPLTYVQGPPGTGKTSTIVNTLSTAFFNGRTVLFSSYNNHPIDGVVEKLTHLTYKGKTIPFPIIRLGNNYKVSDALDYMLDLYQKTQSITIFESSLAHKKDTKIEATQQLSALLERHEQKIDLLNRKETLEQMMQECAQDRMDVRLELSEQLNLVNQEIGKCGEITTQAALALLKDDSEEFLKYLFYTSAQHIQRISEPKNKDLLDILEMTDSRGRVAAFNRYLSSGENLKKFTRIFPIIATTCISAQKVGPPEPFFDMIIMDEASQCNSAVSLVPILRGKNLMLVGDPQQLNPVIVLDEADNNFLRDKYGISAEYDYTKNSIYKTFLACDSVSDEILLHNHYRCHKKIIDFNNQKYYNQKLNVLSHVESSEPLVYLDVPLLPNEAKNTSMAEAEAIAEFAKHNVDRKIGVITPFVNQKNCINEVLREENISDISCGTVHAFQGDEKDVILFSLALTDHTSPKTYQWLKSNKELINVATSRACEQLIVLANHETLKKLHLSSGPESDDIYELVEYVRSQGTSEITPKSAASRALGIKPYSTETEAAFWKSLNHAMDNIDFSMRRYVVHKEVAISQVFESNTTGSSLFYTGRFDFVLYEKLARGVEVPVFAIELDGKEHFSDSVVQKRDREKAKICKAHGFQLIRIENTYARRYHYIKSILLRYFARK